MLCIFVKHRESGDSSDLKKITVFGHFFIFCDFRDDIEGGNRIGFAIRLCDSGGIYRLKTGYRMLYDDADLNDVERLSHA